MHRLVSKTPFLTESGVVLPELEFVYHTYGTLNLRRDNVIWVCHALTANADAADWWSGLIGPGKILDTDKYFVICANSQGSCYGATNPHSINPATGRKYGKDFPVLTIRDLARAHEILRKQLNINRIRLLIGGSMGGQQILEWAIMQPNLAEQIVVMATNAKHSAWGIAYNEAQRMALEADPTLYSETETAGQKGLEAARAVAMLSYRNYTTYNRAQTDNSEEGIDNFKVSSYQRYQGKKLRERFTALSYYTVSKSMDTHNVGRGRGGAAAALAKITAPTLVISISSDELFPPAEQNFLAENIPQAQLRLIDSSYGHDGFLIEFPVISVLLEEFMNGENAGKRNINLRAMPGTEVF